MKPRIFTQIFCLFLLLSCLTACTAKTHDTKVLEISNSGNAVLDSFIQELEDDGIKIGDTVIISVQNEEGTVKYSGEMPLVKDLIPADGTIQLWYDEKDASLDLCIYNGNFYETYNIRTDDIVLIDKK